MIRHDHIAFKRQSRIGRRDILYCLIDHFSVGRQFNVLRAINDRPYIFPKTILLSQRTYCNKICAAGTVVIIFQTISFSLGKFFFIIHLHHLCHYNTYRQRKQVLCRNSFVGTNCVRPFWFCGCLRATSDRPYGKHPYEHRPKPCASFILSSGGSSGNVPQGVLL